MRFGFSELRLALETAWGGGEEKGCGKFKRQGKELPFVLTRFLFIYFWNTYFLLDEEIEETASFYTDIPGETPSGWDCGICTGSAFCSGQS